MARLTVGSHEGVIRRVSEKRSPSEVGAQIPWRATNNEYMERIHLWFHLDWKGSPFARYAAQLSTSYIRFA